MKRLLTKSVVLAAIQLISISAITAEVETTVDLDSFNLINPHQAPIEIEITNLDGASGVFLLGGSEGHGGDFKEMKIANFAWDIYAKLSQKNKISSGVLETLKRVISNLEVELVDSVSIDGLKRDALNLPSQIKIYLTTQGYDFLTDESEDFNQRAQFLIHELLPLMGLDDADYKASALLKSFLEQSVEQPRPKNLYDTLYSTHFDFSHDGLAFSKAHEICESVKKTYEDSYFAVYCTYQERRSYPYYSDFGHRRFHRRYRRFRHFDFVYGLKVIGLGRVGELQENFILNGRVADMPTYRSHAEAMYECTKIVAVQDDFDFTYYKAKCVAFAFEDGHRFSIVTKNPLIK